MRRKTIRMRLNKKHDSKCDVCGDERSAAIEMIDIQFGNKIITICDWCSNVLFNKTLQINCKINEKVKSKKDINIIAARGSRNRFK